jgi:hypothetical protein
MDKLTDLLFYRVDNADGPYQMVGTLGDGIVFKCGAGGGLEAEFVEEVLVDNFNARFEQYPRVLWTFGYGKGQKKSLSETTSEGTAFEIFFWYYPGSCSSGYCPSGNAAGADAADATRACMDDAAAAASESAGAGAVPLPREKELMRLQETLHTRWGTKLNKVMVRQWLGDIVDSLTGADGSGSGGDARVLPGTLTGVDVPVADWKLATVDGWFLNILDEKVDIYVDNR